MPVHLPSRCHIAATLAVLLALAGCGGGEQTSADRAAVQSATRDDAAVQHLFLPDPGHAALLALASATPAAGATVAGTTLATSGPTGNNVQIDAARDELYVLAGRSVNVYASAATLSAGAAPARSFALPASLRTPRTLFLDAASDVLYVGGDTLAGMGEILAWDFAHTVRGTPATPARALVVDGGLAFFTLDLQRRLLYVASDTSGVQVFADVDTASGLLRPSSSIALLGTGLALDAARDRLYVADMFAGLLLVDQASTGNSVVSGTLGIDDARYVAFDAAHDRVHVSAPDQLYTLEHASALTSGTTLPAAAISGGATTGFGTAAVR